jgi:cob(I)alamin adenosyltransferase
MMAPDQSPTALAGRSTVGHRLSKIYTRTGDDGSTGLANGERVDKCDERIEACGAIDETNSAIGLLLCEAELPAAIRESLLRVQHELFEIGAELTLPGYVKICATHVASLEHDLDALNAELPPLKEFVLPGGNRAAATCHVARATCRRAERRAWAAAKRAAVNTQLQQYLNRLSDLLFVMARCLARQDDGHEVLWHR